MKYLLTIIAGIWLMSCSTEYPAPSPPTFISGTANNQVINQNTVINLSNGDSLTLRLSMTVPNELEDIRVEAIGISSQGNGNVSRIDLTENATFFTSQGDSIYTNITIGQVVDNLEDLPYVVGSPSQTRFKITLIDSEFLTARIDFKVERQ